MAYLTSILNPPPKLERTLDAQATVSPPTLQRTFVAMYTREIGGSLWPPDYDPPTSIEFAGGGGLSIDGRGSFIVDRNFAGTADFNLDGGGQVGVVRSFAGGEGLTIGGGGGLGVPVKFAGGEGLSLDGRGEIFTNIVTFTGGGGLTLDAGGAFIVERVFSSEPVTFEGGQGIRIGGGGLLADVFFHADFEINNWREFDTPPAGSGAGAVIAQDASAAMPDRGSVGMLVTLSSGTGTRTVFRDLGEEKTSWFFRVMFATDTVAGGTVDFARLDDGNSSEVASLTYTPSTRTITATLATSDTLTGTLPAGIDWHAIELHVDTASDHAELWINGHSVDTAAADFENLVAQTVIVGVVGQDTATAGSMSIDEVAIANRYIGPVRVIPTLDHAGDPPRVLVIYNTDVTDSRTFAEWYRGQRDVPAANLVGVSLGSDEQITAAAAATLKSDLQTWLKTNYLDPFIRTIVLGYGCPGTTDAPGSLQGRMARLDDDTDDLTSLHAVSGVADVDDLPDRASLTGQYLVAELNAPTLAEAQAIVTAGLALVTTDLVDREFTALDPASDKLAASAASWADLAAWLDTVPQQQVRLPRDEGFDGSSHGHAIEFTDAVEGGVDVTGQTKALLVTRGDSTADTVRS